MRYNELWRKLAEKGYAEGEAKAVARTLLADKYGMTMADMLCEDIEDFVGADALTTGANVSSLDKDIDDLLAFRPVQYVVGKAWFCDRQFIVRQGCLIPRPETEELCRWIVSDSHTKTSILDIGTGSGCIAITLFLDINDAKVDAWDISDDAIAIAKDNVKALEAKVNIEKIDALNSPYDIDKYDIIVSNPPYICNKEKQNMDENVLEYEPHTALFVPDENALLFYRSITRYAFSALRKGGRLYFEINPLYSEEMVRMLEEEGLREVELREDQFGKQRFIKATKI